MVANNYAVVGQGQWATARPTVASSFTHSQFKTLSPVPDPNFQNRLMETTSLASPLVAQNDNDILYAKLWQRINQNPQLQEELKKKKKQSAQADLEEDEEENAGPAMLVGATMGSPGMTSTFAMVGLTETVMFLHEQMNTPPGMNMQQAKQFLLFAAQKSAMSLVQDVLPKMIPPSIQAMNPLAFQQLEKSLDGVMKNQDKPVAPQMSAFQANQQDMAATSVQPLDQQQLQKPSPLAPKVQQELKAIASNTEFNPHLLHDAQQVLSQGAVVSPPTTEGAQVATPPPVQNGEMVANGAAPIGQTQPPRGPNEDKVHKIVAEAKQEKAKQNARKLEDVEKTHLGRKSIKAETTWGTTFYIPLKAENVSTTMSGFIQPSNDISLTNDGPKIEEVGKKISQYHQNAINTTADTMLSSRYMKRADVYDDYNNNINYIAKPIGTAQVKDKDLSPLEIARQSKDTVTKSMTQVPSFQGMKLA